MGSIVEAILKPFIYTALIIIAFPIVTYWLIDDWRKGKLRDYEKHD